MNPQPLGGAIPISAHVAELNACTAIAGLKNEQIWLICTLAEEYKLALSYEGSVRHQALQPLKAKKSNTLSTQYVNEFCNPLRDLLGHLTFPEAVSLLDKAGMSPKAIKAAMKLKLGHGLSTDRSVALFLSLKGASPAVSSS